ncbi:MAG: DinB family protein [Vicinamibacterales bacterium]
MTVDDERPRRTLALDEAVGVLRSTPEVVEALLRGRPDSWARAHEGPGTWSPFDVVGHLIHAERTDWIPRVRCVMEYGESRAFDDFDREAQFAASSGRSCDNLLDEFRRLRLESLRALSGLALTMGDLNRRGRHPALGTVTVRQLIATWVAHDFDHVVQISRVLAKQYSDEVGPWRAYLRVINGSPV